MSSGSSDCGRARRRPCRRRRGPPTRPPRPARRRSIDAPPRPVSAIGHRLEAAGPPQPERRLAGERGHRSAAAAAASASSANAARLGEVAGEPRRLGARDPGRHQALRPRRPSRRTATPARAAPAARRVAAARPQPRLDQQRRVATTVVQCARRTASDAARVALGRRPSRPCRGTPTPACPAGSARASAGRSGRPPPGRARDDVQPVAVAVLRQAAPRQGSPAPGPRGRGSPARSASAGGLLQRVLAAVVPAGAARRARRS